MKDTKLEISNHEDDMNIVVETDNYKKVITISRSDIRIFNLDKEPKAELLMRRSRINEDFHRVVETLIVTNELSVLEGLVPVKIKASFLKDYQNGDKDEED